MKDKKPLLLFKYGGNAMTSEALTKKILQNICSVKDKGYHVVIVHGGGPFIQEILTMAKLESEFIDGHRKTTSEALIYVEMALKGRVNGNLVRIINQLGYKAFGMSGKDGKLVTAAKRMHTKTVKGKTEEFDLGQVGDVAKVNTTLTELLLENDYIPVITCIASGEDGEDYNINGDMFAGHIAGALKAEQFVVLTDVDGLLKDKDDPSTLIRNIRLKEINPLVKQRVIQGGMIPKMESCEIAIKHGADSARIINGTRPGQILSLAGNDATGTLIGK